MRIIFGIFFILHGLVHLLYYGHSARFYELKPGMSWPDGAWVFTKILGDEVSGKLADILLILAAVGFIAGGIGILIAQGWWRPLIIGTAAFSTLIFIVLWNGRLQNLDGQGGVGILINAAILILVLLFYRVLTGI